MAANASADPQFELVFVGDGGVGKTCAILTYINGAFPGPYIPTIFDRNNATITVDTIDYVVAINEPSIADDNDLYRPALYPTANVILVFFSCCNIRSFERVETQWLPEILKHAPNAALILVCTKTDLRNDPATIQSVQNDHHRLPIDTEEGQRTAKRLGFKSYLEISTLTQPQTLQTLFTSAAKLALRQSTSKKATCTLL